MRKVSRKLNIADKSRRGRTVWKRVVSAMAVIVVFCTVYALVLPAITLSEEPICGQQAHEHTEACYRSELLVFDCAAAKHVHDESCQGTLENPSCGFGERILHTHAENCYDQLGELICPLQSLQEHLHDETCQGRELICELEETPGHSHGNDCTAEPVLVCDLEEVPGHTHSEECTAEAALICGLTETAGHVHTDACYEEQTVLTCQKEELQPHTHGDECYGISQEPSCGQEHDHEETCYRKVLTCTLEETAGHTHGDDCYTTEQTLICTEPEVQPHTHSESCWSQEKTCELEEVEGHTHTQECWADGETCSLEETQGHTHSDQCYQTRDEKTCEIEQVADHVHTASCFDAEGNRICGLISGVVHVHDETCFKVIRLDEPELICQLPVHIHVDACYLDPGDLPPAQKEFYCDKGEHSHHEECYLADGTLTCNIPEHTHDVSCKVPDYDPEADVETAEDWESTVKDVSLTGKWPTDLLSIAQTQLGYRESKQNVVWNGDDTVSGYSRYGARFEAPYIDWSAAFVSFCVNYAQVDVLPQDASCQSYYEKLEGIGLLRDPMNYLPKPGDLVLLDSKPDDEQAKADQMGIVAELLANEAGEYTIVKVLQGDASDEVKYLTYDLISNRILGYGETPVGESKVLLCDLDHEHTTECYGFKLYYTDDTLQAEVLIEGVEELPVDVTLVVHRITSASDPAGYGSMIHALSTRMQESPYYMGDASFYQMELFRGGESYQLPEGAKTSVDVSFTDPVFTPEAMEGAAKVETFLLTPNESQEQTDAPVLSGTISSSMSQALAGGQGTEETDGDAAEEAYDTYQVEQVEEDTYENASGGLTGLGFKGKILSTIAVVLSNTTKEGQFWERIFSVDDITSGGTYMIVSTEGNFALRGDNSNNYTAVTIHAQKGEEDPDAAWDENPERNTKYYTITTSTGAAVDNNLFWTITKSGSSYTIRNQGTSRYLSLSRSSVISSSSANLKLTYQTPENGWWIANSSRYLKNAGTGSFTSTTSTDGQYSSSAKYYNTREMLIFKLSDKTSLEIPDDVVNSTTGSGDTGAAPEKPDYGEFIDPTGGLQGETAVTQGDVTISGQYYSDPATSDIETQFRQDSYEASQIIDGKVVTDKSVIYGDDDYNAFASYDPNTFSVALSTLGQEYEIPYQYMIKTPVDVVFILDASGSMSSRNSTQGEDYKRISELKDAVNTSMAQIMGDHEANRVGIAVYSGGAWEMLPLDRYTADNGEYLVTSTKTFSHSPTNISFTIDYLLGSSSLKNEAGVSYANAGEDAVQGIGTYTQAGIAMGNEIFEAIGDDTTYTTTLGEGENARPFTVTRQPVFVLVSDGEPTYSTPIYNDVLKGPHYGNGSAGSSNGKGIHGYYTVLSANYYKRAVSIQYEKEAMFYSIGMSIEEEGDGPMVSNSQTGDNYKRAVLNPTPEVIETLDSDMVKANTVDQLKGMLQGTYSDRTVTVSREWPEEWTGIPHVYEPVLQPNPYADDYAYADGAFFGDLPAERLEEIFDEIYKSSVTMSPYGFVLYRNSSVNMYDHIGEGMEIKGTPVLRYNGVNYTNPEQIVSANSVSYIYRRTVTDPYIPNRSVDLSEITVTITTNEDGTQSVYMYVPDTALPTYTPELVGQQFYYEQLPVRLIYQVGLTEESEAEILELNETGGELVYYTNKWGTDDLISTSTLLPSTANPFYYHIDGTEAPYKEHHSVKSENPTDTVDYHVDCHRDIGTIAGEVLVEVIHKQGNNGKLVFSAVKDETIDLTVKKNWGDGINAGIMNPVEVVVYKVTETVNAYGAVIRNAEAVQSVTLSGENNWEAIAAELPKPEEGWYYALAEVRVPGYTVTYDQETIKITADGGNTFIDAAKVNDTVTTVTMTNTVAVQLPSTGGGGTYWYTLGGMLLMSAAVLLWYSLNLKRRREERPYP